MPSEDPTRPGDSTRPGDPDWQDDPTWPDNPTWPDDPDRQDGLGAGPFGEGGLRDPYRSIHGGNQDRCRSGGAGESEVSTVAGHRIMRHDRTGRFVRPDGTGPDADRPGTPSRRERMANALDRYSLALQVIQVFPIVGLAAATIVSSHWLGYLLSALLLLAGTAWVVRLDRSDRSDGQREARREARRRRADRAAHRDGRDVPGKAGGTGNGSGIVARVQSVSLLRPIDPLGRAGDEPAVPDPADPARPQDALIQAEVTGANGNINISIWLRPAPAIPPQVRRRPHPPHAPQTRLPPQPPHPPQS